MAKITKELLTSNGWTDRGTYANLHHKDGWYAEYRYGRDSLSIWEEKPDDAYNADIFVRVCDTKKLLTTAFLLLHIDYRLTERAEKPKKGKHVPKKPVTSLDQKKIMQTIAK